MTVRASGASVCNAGEKRSCRIPLAFHDGVSDCVASEQVCHEGAWSKCGDPLAFCAKDASTSTASLVAGGETSVGFANAWNEVVAKAGYGVAHIGISGLKIVNAPRVMAIGADSATFDPSSPVALVGENGKPVALSIDVDPITRMLRTNASASGAISLRLTTKVAVVDLPIESLQIEGSVSAQCDALDHIAVTLTLAKAAGSRRIGGEEISKLFGDASTWRVILNASR
ncbi:MAG: hypothetical protein NVS3B20_10500 [Polyangiales bacterium]